MPIIKVLDKQVSELIAAGEVIERPASIVKELMENSIDAKATAITVEIKNGGLKYIRITDNGCGIASDDVSTAFLRHATSKVATEQDLDGITTLGFRGEALASICAVSKVEMLTKRPQDDFGTRAVVEGGEVIEIEQAGCPDGTTIIVRELFYNVPARLKFMKKDASEGTTIGSMVDKLALSNSKVSMKFIKENKEGLHSPGDGKLYSAMYAVLSKDVANNMVEVDYEYNAIKITGYVSIPEKSRASRSLQNFFVCGRYVRSKVALVATEEAYKTSVMTGKFPACVLNIEINPNEVDINVHPAKIEVRFAKERSIFDAVYFAVKSALAKHNEKIKPQGFSAQVEPVEEQKTVSAEPSKMAFSARPDIMSRINFEDEEKAPPKQTMILRDDNVPTLKQEQPSEKYEFIDMEALKEKATTEQKTEEKFVQNDSIETIAASHHLNTLGEIFGTYILAEQGDDFFLVDKHAAHERVVFEQLKKGGKATAPQALLQPITVTLLQSDYGAVVDKIETINDMGFEMEDFGEGCVIVRAVPQMLDQSDIANIITEIADNIKNLKKDINPAVIEDIYHSIACKTAIRAGDKNSLEELDALVRKVIEDDNVRYCPHGRPVVVTMTKAELTKKFGRT